MKIINLSDSPAQWNWLADEYIDAHLIWEHVSTQSIQLARWLPGKQHLTRFFAANKAFNKANHGHSLLVSHGPRPAFYSSSIACICNRKLPHLVYSFNFTQLPTGMQHKLMAKAYQQPQKFVTYSTAEKQLYSDYFDIPTNRIDMIHWSVHRPHIDLNAPRIVNGDYICALGSQGRDFHTLLAAMKLLPSVQLVIVTHPQYLHGLNIPDNVKVLTDVPLKQAHNVLAHSQLMVVPLRDSEVPCGHVTIVSGMFFSKPMIVTNSIGVHDYIEDGETGLFHEAKNPIDLADKIEKLLSSPQLSARLAKNSLAFAEKYCTEKTVLNYFNNFLNNFSTR